MGKGIFLRQNATRLTLWHTKPPPMGTELKRPRRGADHPSHLAQKLGYGGAIFPLPNCAFIRPALWPTQPPIQWVPDLFPGGKTAGAWRSPPTLSSAKVKERVELFFYSPPGPSWPFIGRTLPLPLLCLHGHGAGGET